MKIAIPVKTNKEDASITPVFGRAKWFKFVENGQVSVERSEASDGVGVIEWLLQLGVDTLIIKNISTPPYQMAKEDGRITIYYAGDEKIAIDELIQKCTNNELVVINDTNSDDLVKGHKRQHKNR